MSDTTVTAPLAGPREATSETTRWRVAGGLGLAHIALMLGAFALEGVAAVEHGTAADVVLGTYAGLSSTRVELASYVEAMAFVPLLAAFVLLAQLLSRTATARTAGQVALGLGIAYVASSFALGFPPLTAAVYAAHHGADATTVATVNDLRNYGFLLQVALTAAQAVALGVAAISQRAMFRWLGWGGVGFGVAGVVAAPFVHNAVSLGWMVWWVGVCVLCLRGVRAGDRVRRFG
jgi:hypothetical protein